MTSDTRFLLKDRSGNNYPVAVLNGKFQIGKGRDELTDDLGRFAAAVIKFGKGGRFLTPTGHKSIMGYGGRARKAVSYWLDPSIAASIGVPSFGTI